MVYASPIPSIRGQLWSYLESFRDRISIPCVLLGDFNEIILPSEVRGGMYCRKHAFRFAKVLEKCNLLVDLGASGNKFTWHRNNNGVRTISKRLDRAVSVAIGEPFRKLVWRTIVPFNRTITPFCFIVGDFSLAGV